MGCWLHRCRLSPYLTCSKNDGVRSLANQKYLGPRWIGLEIIFPSKSVFPSVGEGGMAVKGGDVGFTHNSPIEIPAKLPQCEMRRI